MKNSEGSDRPSKVVFLDIDGVIQPLNYEHRFDHINEIDELNKELLERFLVDYSKYDKYDVMAVF